MKLEYGEIILKSRLKCQLRLNKAILIVVVIYKNSKMVIQITSDRQEVSHMVVMFTADRQDVYGGSVHS